MLKKLLAAMGPLQSPELGTVAGLVEVSNTRSLEKCEGPEAEKRAEPAARL